MSEAASTKLLSIPAEAKTPDASHTGLPSGAAKEQTGDAKSTFFI